MRSFSKKEIEALLDKYLENKLTQDDMLQLFELFRSSENEELLRKIVLSHFNEIQEYPSEIQSIDFDRIYHQLLFQLKQKEKTDTTKRLFEKRSRVRRLIVEGISIAAVVCIAFLSGSLIHRDRSGIAGVQPKTDTYVEVRAPLGARSEVTLSDGTELILNAGSTIKYRSDYNSLNRDLYLSGEAYFKVAKNRTLPLVVSAGNINIKATGTEFNIKAYAEDGIIEATLIEGEIEIVQEGDSEQDRVLVLKPNQKAIYTRVSDHITMEKIREIEPLAVKPSKIDTEKLLISPKTDIEQATAWTEKRLIIKRESLESLCIKLQRKYDVTFVFDNEEIKKYRFSGVLLDETFDQVMAAIKLSAPVDYSINRKTVTLTINQEMMDKYSKHANKDE